MQKDQTYKPTTTRYNDTSEILNEEGKYLIIKSWINSYEFQIISPGYVSFLELNPDQIKRLIKNLTLALEYNKH